MKAAYFLFIVISVLVLTDCKESEKYKTDKSGLQYKFIHRDTEEKKIQTGNILALKLKYYNRKDSLLFNSEELPADFRVKVTDADKDGLIQNALKMMCVGDSASFLIRADNFFKKTKKDSVPGFISPEDFLRFEIKVVGIVSEEQINKEYKQFLIKKELEERQILNEYLSAENIKEKPTSSGIYIIKLKKGNGKKAAKGNKVTINFTGKYINGKVFDSSIDKGIPLTFVLGGKFVIPAWNEAIQTMREGDKIKLIAPSKTAYGKKGLKGYVPPFTTLVYEIKLLKVN